VARASGSTGGKIVSPTGDPSSGTRIPFFIAMLLPALRFTHY
jgi:hypothetical protein